MLPTSSIVGSCVAGTEGSDDLRFDDRVVVVTGAGNGIGRAHALEFAARGAKVVVNDIGVARFDRAADGEVADRVVAEITATGGQAIADQHTVTTPDGGEGIIATALDTWGRVDAGVSNAGNFRDRTFAKATLEEITSVLDTHLLGAFHVLQPAFRAMKEAGRGGHIVTTASTSGLYGLFGQAAYSSAKGALIALTKVLAFEGRPYGIVANAIAPVASTRVRADADPTDPPLTVDDVSPFVAALCHESCPASGELFVLGGGIVRRVMIELAPGAFVEPFTAENVALQWPAIRDTGGVVELADAMAIGPMLREQLAALRA